MGSSLMDMACAGLGMWWVSHGLDWIWDRLGRLQSETAMGWYGHLRGWLFAWQAIGCSAHGLAGHGLGRLWAQPSMCWAVHGLGSLWTGLAICWAGVATAWTCHGMGQTRSGPAMGWAAHWLGWVGHGQVRAGYFVGWPWALLR
jgi:hypothetical protein